MRRSFPPDSITMIEGVVFVAEKATIALQTRSADGEAKVAAQRWRTRVPIE